MEVGGELSPQNQTDGIDSDLGSFNFRITEFAKESR